MVLGYLEGATLLFKELLCNLSILELCSMLTLCIWCVVLLFYDIYKHLDHKTYGVGTLKVKDLNNYKQSTTMFPMKNDNELFLDTYP
jgi:hypothetical protein